MRWATRLAVVLILALGAPAAEAAFPGQNGRIAFQGFPGSGSVEIYTMNADGSGVQRLTNDGVNDLLPTWSPDGARIAFARGTGSNQDIYVMNPDGSGQTPLTNTPGLDSQPAWSPDGTKLAFVSTRDGDADVWVMNADGSSPVNLTDDNGLSDLDPAWSPDGGTIAFSRRIDDEGYSREVGFLYTMHADGTGKAAVQYGYDGPSACEGILTNDHADWSPDALTIAYHGVQDYDGDFCLSVESVNRDGTGRLVFETVITGGGLTELTGPAWSPDGTRLAYGRLSKIRLVAPDGSGAVDVGPAGVSASHPDWQPLPERGYVRPAGATPIRLSLVPAFAECTNPNRIHGYPLASDSCAPPIQSSTYLTVGTAPVNGQPAQSVGKARLQVRIGNPTTAADEADVVLRVNVTDVRIASDLSDYVGELLATARLRITDRLNAPHPGGPGPGTVSDFELPFPVQCAATPDGVGATCATQTTADALLPGAVQEGRRAVWGLEDFELSDGGPQASPVDRPFLRPGVFVP